MSYTSDILDFMAARPKQEFSAEDLSKHFGWATYNASSRFSNARYAEMGRQCLKPGSKPGTWKYVPAEELDGDRALEQFVTQAVKEAIADNYGEPLQPPKSYVGFEQIMVTIIKEVDGEMVVVDDNTNVYRMVKVA